MKGRYLVNGFTLGVKNLLQQVVPLVVIFGETSKHEVLGKMDLKFELVVKVL